MVDEDAADLEDLRQSIIETVNSGLPNSTQFEANNDLDSAGFDTLYKAMLRAFAATQLEDPMIVMLGLTQPGRMVSSADGAQLGLLDYLAMQPWPGYETSIEVSLICEHLFMISELEFTFEVGFQLMLSLDPPQYTLVVLSTSKGGRRVKEVKCKF